MLVTRCLVLFAILLARAAISATVLPGHEAAINTGLGNGDFIWVNPARLGRLDSSDVRFGFLGIDRTSSIYAQLRLPLGIAAAIESERQYGPNYYFNDNLQVDFQTLALAKRGLAAEGWLSRITVGLSGRYFHEIPTWYSNRFDGDQGARSVFAFDGGISFDMPFGLFGDLTAGLYNMQTSSAFAQDRLTGLQALWADASGRWDLTGNVVLIDPIQLPDGYNEYEGRVSRDIPGSRIGLDFRTGRWTLGGEVLPSNGQGGLSLGWRYPLHIILWDIGLNIRTRSVLDQIRPGFSVQFDAGFRGPRSSATSRTYAEYRRQRHPVPIVPDTAVATDTAVLPSVTAVGRLSEADWARNWALYQEDKIGFWRGTAWPYVNTFGYITTLVIPAGTSCLAVNQYVPGSLMLAGSLGFFALAQMRSVEVDTRFSTFIIGQISLKLVDFIWARHSVKKHNEALRRKFHLVLAPGPEGLPAALVLAEF